MSNSKTGGSAFPLPLSEYLDVGDKEFHGISARDYFAAKAMQALIQLMDNGKQITVVPEAAYQIADAMLKARSA